MTPAPSLPAKKTFVQSLIKGYGLPVVCILGSIILLLISVRPALTKIQALRNEQAEIKKLLSVLTNKIENIESFAARGEALDLDFALFDQAVPSESNIPTLLIQLQTIAKQAGVEITVLQFGGQIGAAAGTGVERKWFEVRVKFASRSSIANFRKLLQTLETATRIIDVESVRYTAAVNEKTKALTLANELTLVSYYTPKPEPSPETPLTFSFDDPTFNENSEVLEGLTPYKTEIP